MADKTIRIKGEFDASGILASFKKIRDEAAKGGIGDKMLSGYDKELEKAEKLTTQMLAQLSKGLNNATDIKEFTRTISQLEKTYSILNVKAASFADTNNYAKQNTEIRKYASELDQLVKKQNELKKVAASQVTAKGEKLKLDKEEINQLKKALDNAEAYKKIIDDITVAKTKALQQDINKAAVNSQAGQAALAKTGNGGNFEFGVAAKKGRDANRANLAKKGVIDEVAAQAAAQKEYQRVLQKTMEGTGSAEDALKEFTEVMRKYKLEVTNADEIQEQFAQDMENIANIGLNTPGKKDGSSGGIIPSQKSEFGKRKKAIDNMRNDLLNDTDVQEFQKGEQRRIELSNQQAEAERKYGDQIKTTTDNINKERTAAEQAGNSEINKRKQVIAEAQKYVSLQQSIENGFNRIGQGAKQILSVTTSWRALRNVVRSTFNDIKDLDKAFGSIAMVTSYSVKDMWAQYDQYAAMANKLGQSTKNVIEASALYYQQGLKTNEVMQLTEETMKLATLAGLDFKEATSQMTAALRAFHMDMSEGAHVTDVYAEVAAHAAVDVQGLSEAMSATAAIANSAGMSFENTTAMLATMVEATQEAPKNLGTAMKTILARFTELKTNVAGTADSEFDDLDYNKVDKALKSVGVSIKDATGQFRNMDEVLLELSSKWKGLDRNSQRYIATIAAGSRQQSRFIALMENYERTMELVDVAQNSAGRSSQQFAKYQDTVEYRLNKISNTWEQFKTNLLTSDFYKDVLDNFNDFLNKLNNTSVAGLTTLAGTWMTFGRRAISGTIDTFSSGVGSIFTGNKAKQKFFEANKDKDGYSMLHVETGELIPDNEALKEGWEEQKAKYAIRGQAIGTAIATSITAGVTATLTSDSAGEAALKSAGMSLLSNVMAGAQAFGWKGAITGLILTGVTAAISAVATSLKNATVEKEAKTTEKLLKSTEKQLENIEKRTEELKSQQKGNNEEIKDLETIQEQYDKLKDKQYLTIEEQEEFNKLVETLQNDYPELIDVYDEENKKLKISTDLLKEKLQKTKEIQEETKQALINETAAAAITKSNQDVLQNREDFKKAFLEKFKDQELKQGNTTLNKDVLAEAFYDQYEKNNFDVEKTIKDIQEQASNDLNIPLNEISSTLKEFFNKYKASKEINLKETAKTNISSSDNKLIVNANEDTKDSLSIALAEMYNKKYKNSSKDKDFLLVTTPGKYTNLTEEEKIQGLGKIASLGSKSFREEYNSNGVYGKYLMNFIDSISIASSKYNEYSKKDKELLSLLQINSEEDLKEFNNQYKTQTEKADALITKLQAAAIGSNNLSDEEIKRISSFDEKLQSIYNSDRKIEESEISINKLRENNKDIVGADKIIDKYNKDLIDYKNFLNRYNIEETQWKNVSIKQGTAIKDNLGKYLDNFNLDADSQGKLANSLYNAIKNSGIEGKGLDALFNINYSELSKGTFDDAVKIIQQTLEDADPKFKETGKGAAKAYLQGLNDKGLVSFITTSADTLTRTIQEKLEENLDFSKTYGEVLNKVLSDQKNLGHIDMSNLKEIRDKITSMGLKPEDFLGQTNQGNYALDYKSFLQAAKEQLGTEEDFIKKKEQERDLGIQQLNLEIQMLEAQKGGNTISYKRYEIEKAITQEKLLQAQLSGQATQNVESYMEKIKEENVSTKDIDIAIDAQIAELKQQRSLLLAENTETYRAEYKATLNYFDEQNKNYIKGLEDFEKENDKVYKDWQDKTKAVADAQKSLAKAIETVTEKQKELKAVIEGTNWKSSVDGMYNYNTALDFLTKQTERAKKNFDKVSSINEAKNNFQIYGQGLLDQKAQLTAQNQTYRTAYNNIGKVYNNDVAKLIKSFEDSGQMKFNLADYLVFDEKTGTKINMNALQKAKMPETLKKWIEEQGKKANEYLSKILDNEDKIDQINEEFLEQQRKARDEYISLQDQMIDVLREKYQQEIDDLQNKYDAMDEADNKYLESLQKNLDRQRKLRDQEKNWNDLTNKERKLSLMQRDTSGGNLADVKNLQNEIEDQRTQLLDDTVDQIIEKLTEFYELQKETRDAEIEYKQTLIDDVALLKEATEALEKIQTSDDLVNWWKKNVTGIKAFSEQKLGKLTEDWNKLFDAKSNYVASIDDKMKESIKDANGHLKEVGDQAEEIVRTTSEGITNLAEQSLQEAGEEYKKAVKTAKDALQDAVDAVAKQKEALQAAIDAANESKKAFDDIHAKYIEHLKAQEKTTIFKVGNTYMNSAQLGNYMASQGGNPNKYGGSTPQAVEVTANKAKTLIQDTVISTKPNPEWKKIYTLGISNNDAKLFKDSTELGKYNVSNHANYTNKQTIELDLSVSHGVLQWNKKDEKWELLQKTDKKEDAEKWLKDQIPKNAPTYIQEQVRKQIKEQYRAFAEGGLVNYTGPAWVDGSRSRPEAFLSSEDTRRIGEAARILADLPILSQPIKEQVPTTTIGDTTIQIDVHVDSIANDYDLDEAMNKVEQRIVNAAKYAGSNVILKKH